MTLYTRVMSWSRDHRDHYAYFEVDGDEGTWHKVKCNGLGSGMRCTAPETMPRGMAFDYNSKLEGGEMDLNQYGERTMFVNAEF